MALAIGWALAHADHASDVVEIFVRSTPEGHFFDPIGVHVPAGTTIRFIVVEGVHDTQAFHPANPVAMGAQGIPTAAQPWDSGMMGGLLQTQPTFEVTLDEEGVYDYFCSPHLPHGMVGRIVVGDVGDWEPDADGPWADIRDQLPTPEEIVAQGVVRSDMAMLAEPPGRSGDENFSLLEVENRIGYWLGGDSAVTEPFFADGSWELLLSAYCFDGIGWVRATVRDLEGTEFATIQVLGQGFAQEVITTPPGTYVLDVYVSVAHVYSWEAVALPMHQHSP